MSRKCLGGAREVTGRCPGGVREVFRRCQGCRCSGVARKLSGRCAFVFAGMTRHSHERAPLVLAGRREWAPIGCLPAHEATAVSGHLWCLPVGPHTCIIIYIVVSGHLLCLPAFYRERAPCVLAGWPPYLLLYCRERAPFVLAGTLP